VHRTQVPLHHQLQKECPHGGRREQVELTFGLTEPREVDRHEVELSGQSIPNLSEGEHALGPGTGEDRRFAPAPAGFGETDLHAICIPDRQLHCHEVTFPDERRSPSTTYVDNACSLRRCASRVRVISLARNETAGRGSFPTTGSRARIVEPGQSGQFDA
jgi:hypothetical protein